MHELLAALAAFGPADVREAVSEVQVRGQLVGAAAIYAGEVKRGGDTALTPEVAKSLEAGMHDPASDARAKAVKRTIELASSYSPDLPRLLALAYDVWRSDPSFHVRELAGEAIKTRPTADIGSTRAMLMAGEAREETRVTAAKALGLVRAPERQGMPTEQVPLCKLAADPSPKVRAAAQVALSMYLRSTDKPSAPAVEITLKLFADPKLLEPQARGALLDAVPNMAQASVPGFLGNADPDVDVAAKLGTGAQTVGADAAIRALSSSAPGVRRLAMASLLGARPAAEIKLAAEATIPIALGSDEQRAWEVMDALTVPNCGPAIGPGVTRAVYSDATHYNMVDPDPHEIEMKGLIDRALAGPAEKRVAAIKEIRDMGPSGVAARWEAFRALLWDDDEKVRAAAWACKQEFAGGIRQKFGLTGKSATNPITK